MKKLLLISNSTNYGEAYLSWPRPFIQEFLHKYQIKNVLFVPFAGVTVNWDDYTTKVRTVFAELGFGVTSVHETKTPLKAVAEAEAIVIGGGNTFNLVYHLHKSGLMEAIAERVNEGIPYMGWSAGANVACPALKTTNDMPIIEPESFDCLNLVPFQINPHYLDANPEGHGGETREQRLEEFLEINRNIFVAGLREGTLLEYDGAILQLKGARNCRVFKHGTTPVEYPAGTDMQFLMG